MTEISPSPTDVSRSTLMADIQYGLSDWAHNMNALQAAALVGVIGATAVIGFAAKTAWERWHQSSP